MHSTHIAILMFPGCTLQLCTNPPARALRLGRRQLPRQPRDCPEQKLPVVGNGRASFRWGLRWNTCLIVSCEGIDPRDVFIPPRRELVYFFLQLLNNFRLFLRAEYAQHFVALI